MKPPAASGASMSEVAPQQIYDRLCGREKKLDNKLALRGSDDGVSVADSQRSGWQEEQRADIQGGRMAGGTGRRASNNGLPSFVSVFLLFFCVGRGR